MSEDAAATDGVSDEQAVANMAPAAWSLAENVTGTGEQPEWFKSDKYATVSDQAKGYKELEGKFGSFTGAPDAYDFKLSEELSEKGVELDSENPLIATFTEMAKESNMSQEMANKLVNMFAEGQFADSLSHEEVEKSRVTEQMALLGDNAQQRVNNIENWATANLTAEQSEGLKDVTTTAAGVQAIEALIAKSRNAPMNSNNMANVDSISMKEIEVLQFAKDEQGNRRMQTDPEYAKMVRQKMEQAAPGENIITVGL